MTTVWLTQPRINQFIIDKNSAVAKFNPSTKNKPIFIKIYKCLELKRCMASSTKTHFNHHTSTIMKSWHFLTAWFSAFTNVCKVFMYWTWRPSVSIARTRWWTTFSETSLHKGKFSWNICCRVWASWIYQLIEKIKY